MKYDFHLIVIGAGSAGLVSASGACALGAKVALIEAHKMGGDCLNYGCIPSKALLKVAKEIELIKSCEQYGIEASLKNINFDKVKHYVHSIIKEIEPHDSTERYTKLGVTVLNGTGRILNDHSVSVNNKIITGKNIVIATGSKPFIPSISGLDSVDYLTNETLFTLDKIPESLVILGAGPMGLEYAQAFHHLGSKVTIIEKNNALLTNHEPEVQTLIYKKLKTLGVTIHLNESIQKIKKKNNSYSIELSGTKINANKLLICTGRVGNTNNLDLKQLGIKTSKQNFIITNNKLQTAIKSIYACGDVIGTHLFTHMASYQASIVIKNCIFRLGRKINKQELVSAIYTQPEIAQVGLTEKQAKETKTFSNTIFINLNTIDRAKTDNDRNGFLKINLNKKKQIIGATIVSKQASELISQLSLAIKNKLKLKSFLNIIFPYPTQSEIIKFAALRELKSKANPFILKLIKAIFL